MQVSALLHSFCWVAHVPRGCTVPVIKMAEKGDSWAKTKNCSAFWWNKKNCGYRHIFMLISGCSGPLLRNLSTGLLNSFNRMVQSSICHALAYSVSTDDCVTTALTTEKFLNTKQMYQGMRLNLVLIYNLGHIQVITSGFHHQHHHYYHLYNHWIVLIQVIFQYAEWHS